jgi:hypothetical protein
MLGFSVHRTPPFFPPLKVGDSVIHPSDSVRNLGVMLMSMEPHIATVVRSLFASLRDMYKARRCLPRDASETMVHAFDYCNFLLFGLPKKQINRLPMVQNSAARLITNTRKYDHITPIFIQLHWLPVEQRIIYKLLLLTFKCLHGLAPSYLSDLLKRKPSQGLRSDDKMQLIVPSSCRVTYGDRAFTVAAPILWNSLPVHIRLLETVSQFKRLLKTHLFKLAYPQC